MHYVYILRCSDGSYYVGRTDDLHARLEAHNAGRASAWTARRRPATLLYQETCPDEKSAMARESQVKHWTRAKKEALIAGNRNLLRRLSKAKPT